jgi:hypothetical protein
LAIIFKKVINNLSSRQDLNLRAPTSKVGEIDLTPLLLVIVAGPGLEPGTSAYETDEITIFYASRNVVERAGFEPATPASSVQCSTN